MTGKNTAPDTKGLAPRRAALSALGAVLLEKRLLAHLPVPADLRADDRARALRLTLATLRHLGRLDQVLAPYLSRKPRPFVANILRLGAAELLIDGAEAYGVVNAMVTLAKSHPASAKSAGLVNAVLRRVDTDGRAAFADLPPQRLPVWLRKAVGGAWGEEVVRAIEAAHQSGAALDLTPRAACETLPDGVDLPTGGRRVQGHVQVSALAGYEEGRFWVQDAAASLPARILAPKTGARVLDLCAAPGGKTMQLAAMGADVTALDISDKRLVTLRANLARTGLVATVRQGDVFDITPDHGAGWDYILLDAPCSATGTIRRHPDLPFVKSAAEIEELTRLQMRMIDHAAGLLAAGGKMVYCTCSILRNEGENQITAALKRRSDLEIIRLDPAPYGGLPEWASAEGGLRILPHHWAEMGGIDGFYIALLQKTRQG